MRWTPLSLLPPQCVCVCMCVCVCVCVYRERDRDRQRHRDYIYFLSCEIPTHAFCLFALQSLSTFKWLLVLCPGYFFVVYICGKNLPISDLLFHFDYDVFWGREFPTYWSFLSAFWILVKKFFPIPESESYGPQKGFKFYFWDLSIWSIWSWFLCVVWDGTKHLEDYILSS